MEYIVTEPRKERYTAGENMDTVVKEYIQVFNIEYIDDLIVFKKLSKKKNIYKSIYTVSDQSDQFEYRKYYDDMRSISFFGKKDKDALACLAQCELTTDGRIVLK